MDDRGLAALRGVRCTPAGPPMRLGYAALMAIGESDRVGGSSPVGDIGRAWYGVTALLAAAALAAQVALAIGGAGDGTLPARLVRLFSYFTIQSNLLVAVVCGLLALDRFRDRGAWGVARLDSVLCIAVTGLVNGVVLAGLVEREGVDAYTDVAFHYLVPALTVAGWFLFGPHGRWSSRTVLLGLAFPVVYLGWTLVRGAVVGEYPYPFIDVASLGYAGALLNATLVTGVFALLGALLMAGDRWAARRGPQRRGPQRRGAHGRSAGPP